jgi:hypothetical protein
MPAPRAVLRDIHDRHLDPRGAHQTDKAGHLKVSGPPVVQKVEPLKPGPKPDQRKERVKAVPRPAQPASPIASTKREELTRAEVNTLELPKTQESKKEEPASPAVIETKPSPVKEELKPVPGTKPVEKPVDEKPVS